MGGAKKAKGKGKVNSSLKGSKDKAAKTGNSQPQVSRIGCCNFYICTDEVAADVTFSEQAMLLLQAGSVADARERMARIQPFWETLSAQSRMDLLSIPVAAAKQQAAELAAKQEAAVLTTLRRRGTKYRSAFEQGARALLQLQSWTWQH